jgi:hypothetical protein
MVNMKSTILALAMVVALSGCAAHAYKAARSNANLVKNGMTVAQASEILGMPPTHTNGNLVQWRRGNAQVYSGSELGSIEFHVVDGRIVDVPEGGIFSPAARQRINAEYDRLQAIENAKREREEAVAAAEKAEKDRLAAEEQKRKEEQDVKDKAQRKLEVAAEIEAADKSAVVCKDKSTCSKVFALSQIYVQQHADQKIQVATDTIIETYNPSDEGKVAITVVKMPRAGTVEVIKITPTCKEGSYHERSCRLRRTEIYRGFKPFIERSLAM